VGILPETTATETATSARFKGTDRKNAGRE